MAAQAFLGVVYNTCFDITIWSRVSEQAEPPSSSREKGQYGVMWTATPTPLCGPGGGQLSAVTWPKPRPPAVLWRHILELTCIMLLMLDVSDGTDRDYMDNKPLVGVCCRGHEVKLQSWSSLHQEQIPVAQRWKRWTVTPAARVQIRVGAQSGIRFSSDRVS